MEDSRFFVIERDGVVLVVSPVRELGSFAEDEVRDDWDRLLKYVDDSKLIHVVLDLTHLSYFGSTMLEMMVVLWKRLSARQGRFAVCNVSEVGREILHIAKFDTIWRICSSRAEGVEVVASNAPMPGRKP